MPTELPQPLLLILPFIAAPLSGWLSHDSLPEEANDAIALTVVLTLAVVADLLTAPISSDITLNFAMIFVYCVLLMNQPLLSSMQRWFTLHVGSPFVPRVAEVEPTITATPVPASPTKSEPQAIDLRSSALPPSRRPQFVAPLPSQHTRPIVQISVPPQGSVVTPVTSSHDTAPMETPAPTTPVEDGHSE